jgi:cytochrome c556
VFQEATSTVENCSLVDAAPLALFESAQTTSAVYSVGANNDHVDTTIFDEGLKNTGSDDEKPRRQEQEHKRQHARHRFFSPTQTRLDVYVPDQRQEVPSATLSSRLQMNTTNPEYREEVEHEGPAPATRTTYAPAAGPDLIIDGEEEQGAVRGTTLNSPQHISPRPMIDPGVNLFGEQQSQGRKTSENLGPRVFDKTLHAVSALDSIRVSKPKKKRKAAGPLHPPITIPEDSDPPKLSSRNDAIVKMLCLALGATESQARETTELNVQAHQTTISSLHKTIGYQDNVIKCHKAENGRLQDEVRSLRETITKQMPNMKKHANGLVKDYENFKAKFKVHQQSCTETVKKMVADFENEKSDLRQEFTNMIDSVDRSRRNTKAALDNCYTRLVISESKKVNLMEQVRQLQHHCEDERKTRADLEQKFMPTLKSLQEHVESSQNVLVEKLDRVLTSLGDNTAEEERDALLKQCNEALHNLQATPFLTAKDVEEAEGRLRLAHTR